MATSEHDDDEHEQDEHAPDEYESEGEHDGAANTSPTTPASPYASHVIAQDPNTALPLPSPEGCGRVWYTWWPRHCPDRTTTTDGAQRAEGGQQVGGNGAGGHVAPLSFEKFRTGRRAFHMPAR